MNVATDDLALRQLAAPGAGEVTTTVGGPLGGLLAIVCGLRAGRERATFDVAPGQPERWIRRFGPRRRTSRVQLDQAGRLIEQIGPLTLCFAVSGGPGCGFADLLRIGIGGLTVPAPPTLSIGCRVRTDAGRTRFRTTTVAIEIGTRRAANGRLASLTYTARLEAS